MNAADFDLSVVPRLSDRLNVEYLEFNGVLPISAGEGRLLVATWLPEPDPQVIDDLRFVFDAEPEIVQAPEGDLRAAIRRAYSGQSVTVEGMIAGLATDESQVRS